MVCYDAFEHTNKFTEFYADKAIMDLFVEQ